METQKKRISVTEVGLFVALIAVAAMANGLSDSVYSNYFKEVYAVDAIQRGFIEFPRELPGVLCAVVIAALSALGDLRLALIAQILACVGLAALGLYTAPFGLMLVFLFVNSLGMHLFMPLQDSIGMRLAEPGKIGKRLGQFASVRSAVGFGAALLVFFGFRLGWFKFGTGMQPIFLIGSALFAVAVVIAVCLVRKSGKPLLQKRKLRFIFRKEYKYYYLLTVLHGVQKQIAFVYGTWVIVDLLLKGADTTALLTIVSSFLCIFFMNLLGRWMDKFGIKKMMYVDALTFIFVYVCYGFVVMGITSGSLPVSGWPVLLVYVLFILDRLSMQIGMVNALYLKSIAVSDSDVTATLSMGVSMDHIVSIIAAMLGGLIWANWGSQWVFFMAAAFSLGNLVIATLIHPEKERARMLEKRAAMEKQIGA